MGKSAKNTGTFIAPEDWDDFISNEDVKLIDVRNFYETVIGKFPKSIDPNTETFTDFINYIGVGPVLPTNSKTDASNAIGEVILEEIIKKVDIPVVAIGGIKLKNINKLKSMGVSGFAMISEIFSSINPEKKFKEFKKIAKWKEIF